MPKRTAPPLRHQVVSPTGDLLGWWTVEGGMLCVRSKSGAVRRAPPSKANDTVARQMLAEAWAKGPA
ncbi:MAG TPA: hypothetical protein VGL58_12970 [Caulobacteraceae bacterium]